MALFNGWPWANFQEQNLDWLIRTVKENTDTIIKNTDDIKVLKNYITPEGISIAVYDVISEMVNNGSLSQIVSAAAGGVVTPQIFGAAGDGVTDDTTAFNSAFASGKAVYIPEGQYNIRGGLSSPLPAFMFSSGAELFVGNHSLSASGSATVIGIHFISDISGAAGTILNSVNNYQYFNVLNCKFTDSIATDIARYRNAVRSNAVYTVLNSCSFYGFISGFIYNNSQNITEEKITINNIYGKNIATLIDIEGAYGATLTGFVENVDISNIVLDNNQTIKSSINDTVGRDAVLVGGVKNISISNVISKFAKERAVYLNNAENGSVTDITAVHSEGVKVAGVTATGYSRWITNGISVDGITVIDGYQAFALKIYDIENCTFKNIYIHGGNYNNPDSFRAIEISRTCKDVDITNVYAAEIGRGILSIDEDPSAQTDIDRVSVCNVRGFNVCKTTAYDTVQFNNTTDINNILLKDWIINPHSDPYLANGNMPHFCSPKNITNLMIDNIVCFGFSSTEEPINLLTNYSNVRIVNTKLFHANANIDRALNISTDSDYICYTSANTGTYTYLVEVQRNPIMSGKHINVKFPCPRNIYGPVNENKNIILQGPAVGNITVNSGTGTASSGFTYNAYGVITGPAGNYKVTVIEE